MPSALPGPLVSSSWLAGQVGDTGLWLIDFRWDLHRGSRRDLYLAGHLPGAAFVAMEDVTGASGPGRHPLPSAQQFQLAMRAAGVRTEDTVVVYDASGGFSAARLWWLLRHFGHSAVAVLDGGLPAWTGPLEVGPCTDRAGDFVARASHGDVVDREQVASRGGDEPLVDARAGERYRGETEPVDPRPGHVPGALNVPWDTNLGPGASFRPAGELRRNFEGLGVAPGTRPIVYCGSGVSACVDILALEVAGLPAARLYEGSWSDWSAQAELPAATGPNA